MLYRDYSASGYRNRYDVKSLFGANYKPHNVRLEVTKTLDECIAEIRKLGIKSGEQYKIAYEAGVLGGFPLNPARHYGVLLRKILGKRIPGSGWPSLHECQMKILQLALTKSQHYADARKAGVLNDFPGSPGGVYGVPWAVLSQLARAASEPMQERGMATAPPLNHVQRLLEPWIQIALGGGTR